MENKRYFIAIPVTQENPPLCKEMPTRNIPVGLLLEEQEGVFEGCYDPIQNCFLRAYPGFGDLEYEVCEDITHWLKEVTEESQPLKLQTPAIELFENFKKNWDNIMYSTAPQMLQVEKPHNSTVTPQSIDEAVKQYESKNSPKKSIDELLLEAHSLKPYGFDSIDLYYDDIKGMYGQGFVCKYIHRRSRVELDGRPIPDKADHFRTNSLEESLTKCIEFLKVL